MCDEEKIPIIDISALIINQSSSNEDDKKKKQNVAEQIGNACKHYGFFYIVGHGIDLQLQSRLETISKQFFALPLETKLKIKMSNGGIAWRGFFPLGGELTSGKADMKEGVYFGEELGEDDPLVKLKTPLHGRNLFPDEIPEFGPTVLEYMKEVTRVGHAVLEGIALSLGLEASYFYDRYTSRPLQLFRIFHYPKVENFEGLWGVGEHTDYGLLTVLKQDDSGGLQVKSPQLKWIEAPPVFNSFVCNIGDMLDRMTGGLYRSTPHRVKCQTKGNRLSYPFFFDPSFNAEVRAIEGLVNTKSLVDDKDQRWDKSSVHQFTGTYGEYLMKKVSKVFPELHNKVI